MTAPSFFKNHGAPAKILSYNRSKDAATADIWATGTALSSGVASNYDIKAAKDGNFQAFVGYDGTNWKIAARTTGSWGTPATLSFTGSLKTGAWPVLGLFKDGSTNVVVVLYHDNSNVLRAKLFTASGTTLTEVLAGDQIVSSIASDGWPDIDICPLSNTRGIAKYLNGSNYHTVIGFTVSATAITEDASASVVKSASQGGTFSHRSAISRTKSNAALIHFKTTAQTEWRISEIADSGSALSVTNEQAFLTEDTEYRCGSVSDEKAYIGFNKWTNFNIALIDSVDGGIADTINVNSTQAFPGLPIGYELYNFHPRGAALGNVDGDGIYWYAIPAMTLITGTLPILFIGVDPTGQPDHSSFVIKHFITGENDYASGSLKLTALTTTSLMASWVDDNLDKYKYKVINL